MATSTQISVDEYLKTSYRPDRDYVDGEVLERNLGERDHSKPQKCLIMFFGVREKEWRIVVLPEQRVQVKPHRFRIPDICVLREDDPDEQIVSAPPLICIEILSKDDTFKSVTERLDDYLAMGVPNIWVIEPNTRRGYVYNADGFLETKDAVLRAANSEIAVPLVSIFES
ncbi:MAG TPA: Uma2 family endonuclease [Bryobacteraceae bacterium]|jgi:Uma2 family endonuclease|nr:Uma2 family endonuclease [Bryobacteraceae bacterium]